MLEDLNNITHGLLTLARILACGTLPPERLLNFETTGTFKKLKEDEKKQITDWIFHLKILIRHLETFSYPEVQHDKTFREALKSRVKVASLKAARFIAVPEVLRASDTQRADPGIGKDWLASANASFQELKLFGQYNAECEISRRWINTCLCFQNACVSWASSVDLEFPETSPARENPGTVADSYPGPLAARTLSNSSSLHPTTFMSLAPITQPPSNASVFGYPQSQSLPGSSAVAIPHSGGQDALPSNKPPITPSFGRSSHSRTSIPAHMPGMFIAPSYPAASFGMQRGTLLSNLGPSAPSQSPPMRLSYGSHLNDTKNPSTMDTASDSGSRD